MTIDISESTDEGQRCFVIATPSVQWYYQSEAGGFSSIVDRDGKDWVDFHPEPHDYPAGAGGKYRGLPNLVFPDNIGHPGYRFCRSEVEIRDESPVIRTESLDGKWAWEVRFTHDSALLTMLRTDPARRYWFLYEGTVGGKWNPAAHFWGTDRHGLRTDTPDLTTGDPAPESGPWQWAFFGDRNSRRVFYINALTTAGQDNLISFMGNSESGVSSEDGMVVAGIGRGDGTEPLLSGNHTFVFGFAESTDHDRIAAIIAETADFS